MKRFDTTLNLIANAVNSGGYAADEVIETQGYTTRGGIGGAKWKSTGNIITASQDPITLNDIKCSDSSGNEFELVLEEAGIIDLNVLGGTSAGYISIANAAGLTYSQGLATVTSITTVGLIASSGTASPAITSGYTTAGDAGNGEWVKNGVTGQTASQSPAQLVDGLLNDGNGDQWVLVSEEYINAFSLGLIADGATDDLAVCNACLAAGITQFPKEIIALSDELVPPIGSGIIGGNPFWKRRTTYNYASGVNTVFKYIGAGGADTTVIRASVRAVGDLAFTLGDDLRDVILRDFHIDAAGLADFALYMYRVGNQANVGNITAEKAVITNHCHMGCFAAKFGVFGGYEAVGSGASIGVDIFSVGTVEATCFDYNATFLLANNGTSNVYVKDSGTDLDNSGGVFEVGRGSKVNITSESNFGRSCILNERTIGGGSGAPVDYILKYLEGNADGPYIDYTTGTDGMRLRDGFLHPGNGGSLASQDITIRGVGPANLNEKLIIERLFGDLSGVPFDIDSDTDNYSVRDCTTGITYTDELPREDGFIPTENQIGASVYFTAAASPVVFNNVNGSLARTGTGTYLFTYIRDFETAGQHTPTVSIIISAALDTNVRITSISETSVTIRTYNNSDALADTGDRIGFQVNGRLV